MQIAFLLYDGFTSLDAIGPYDVLNRIPGAEPVFIAEQAGPVETEARSLKLIADKSLDEVPNPEIILVPGGINSRSLLENEALLGWIRNAHETSTWTTSVCSGALLLAAAGILDGVPATTHWIAREQLGELGAKVVTDRVVREGKIVTAAGVSAGIDMALTLVREMYGPELSQAIQLGIEYDPEPPFDAGSPEKAPQEIVDAVTAIMEQATADASA